MSSSTAAARKYLYGVTRNDYQDLLNKQHGKCAACGEGETRLKSNGDPRGLSVDHCHTTGIVRGLLCDRCNTVLGRVKDSSALLRRLASYLEITMNQPARFINVDQFLAELHLEGETSCRVA